MISIKIDDKPYKIPTKWEEVKFLDFALSREDVPVIEKLSYYSKIPLEILSKFTLKQLSQIIEIVSFQEEEPMFFDLPNCNVKIADEAFWKLKDARIAIANKSQWVALIDVVKIYCDKDISNMSVVEAGGYGAFFLSSLTVSSKDTKL